MTEPCTFEEQAQRPAAARPVRDPVPHKSPPLKGQFLDMTLVI